MNKFVIMGVQGSGKGTQAKLLARNFDLVHLSVGDIFRWHIQTRTKLGTKISRLVDSGQLVPDEIVEEIVRRRLDEHDWNFGLILDGFPRNRTQAAFLLEHYKIDAVIYIDIADDVVVERIRARRLCSSCGRDYNLIHSKPTVESMCDDCGSPLVCRRDDNEAAIRERITEYHDKTEPVLALFRDQAQVVHIDGTQSVDEVQADIRAQLGLNESATRK